ncbi:hypothetical protein KFL_001240170 [Klebsormidium nitens]|uniref:Uncharacterized protein n=1 Tax=Klebsormidium nitens TaxID=105231 RepID=A0A1Y1I211_KLENI|nr:hypothetical protein KFL_001240170 [Klebsormidium nitens]|eukprot:GAQ82786.1 hypothetical protein KFL_001240170 [Klebsormidium nitens]
MELFPGCWSRVQRYLLSQTFLERHCVVAQYFLSDRVGGPQNGHNLVNGSSIRLQAAAMHWLSSSSINDSGRIADAPAVSKVGPPIGSLSQNNFIGTFSSSKHSLKVPTASLVGNAVTGVQPLGPQFGGGLCREELTPFSQSHACNGQRSIHASPAAAGAEVDGQSGISNIVNEMIEYCNTCRSRGSYVEALRILETAEQAASQASGFPQKEALGRIQLAKAAVQCDRCEYGAAVDTLWPNFPDLATNHSDDRLRHITDASLHAAVYIMLTLNKDEEAKEMVNSAVKACPSRKELFERTGLDAALAAAAGEETPADTIVKSGQSQVLAEAFGHCAAGPFVEVREAELSEALRTITYETFWTERGGSDTDEKNFLEDVAMRRLGSQIKKASAITGDKHPRMALVLILLGRVFAKLADHAESAALLAESSFNAALKILEGPSVASSGAYSEATDLTKACLAAVLKVFPWRESEADRVASAVKDRRLLDDGVLRRAFILGLEGRVHMIVDKR